MSQQIKLLLIIWVLGSTASAPKDTTVEASLKDGEIVSLVVNPESRMKDVLNMN